MSDDRREKPRYNVSLDVIMHVGGGGETIRGKSADISRDGMFIATQRSIPRGRRVSLIVDTGVGSPIITTGFVVHSLKGVGVGVRFAHLFPAVEVQIDELIARLRGTSSSQAG